MKTDSSGFSVEVYGVKEASDISVRLFRSADELEAFQEEKCDPNSTNPEIPGVALGKGEVEILLMSLMEAIADPSKHKDFFDYAKYQLQMK
jgi:hypothetical protein